MIDFPALLSAYPTFRPTAGHSLIRMERKPEFATPHIISPEVLRDLGSSPDARERDLAYFGTVLHTTPRHGFTEDFKAGDRVWVMLLASDLNEEYILTDNTRVYAREKRKGER